MLAAVLLGAGPAGPYLALTIAGIIGIAVLRGRQLFARAHVSFDPDDGRLTVVNASGRGQVIDASDIGQAIRQQRGQSVRTILVTRAGDVFMGFDHRVWPVSEVDGLLAVLGIRPDEV